MKYPEKPSERFLKTNTQIQIQYTQMFSWRIQITMASTQLFLPHSQQSLFELSQFIPKVLTVRTGCSQLETTMYCLWTKVQQPLCSPSKSSSKNLNHIYRSIYLASLHILPPYPSRQIPRCPSHRDRRGCAKNHWKGGHENCEI